MKMDVLVFYGYQKSTYHHMYILNLHANLECADGATSAEPMESGGPNKAVTSFLLAVYSS